MGEITMVLGEIISTGVWALWGTYSNDIKEAVLRTIGKKASKKTKELTQAAWERVDWKISASKYQQRLLEAYGTIRILGKPEPVSLEGIFTDVLILETPTAFRRYDIKTLQHEPEHLEKQPRKNGIALVKDTSNRRIFILGKPGAGKTTFLKYLTIQAAKGEIEKIPIFVSLKEWADSELDLMKFLDQEFDICGFPDARHFVDYILDKGSALVLFDGLDEVNQEGNRRARMINELRNFSNKYSKAQCLITCRVAATEYTFERFIYVELADFTDRQVSTFVKKWFKGSRKKRQIFDEAFNRPENRRLQELTRTPLLLSLLCLSFDATLDIPQRRVEIYEESVEALLKKWDTSRSIKRDEIYRGLSLGRKRQMFARIAAQSFQEGKIFFKQTALSKQIVAYLLQLPNAEESEEIDGDAVLKAIEAQHGIFTERAHRIYSFSHLTFQEYFTAKHIVADTTGRALRGLLATGNLTDDRWREVISLTVSLLDNADDFFDIFLNSLDELAAREPLLVSLLEWVKSKTESHLESAVALRGYYCYLILNLIIAPSFSTSYQSDRVSTSSLTFGLNYSASQIIDICFALAKRLDHSRSLSQIVTNDTETNIEVAGQSLSQGDFGNLGSLPKYLVDLKTDIAAHLSYSFFFALTITNLRGVISTTQLTNKLRAYFVELRKYAISLSPSGRVGYKRGSLASDIGYGARDLVVPTETAPSYTWTEFVQKIHTLVMQDTDQTSVITKERFTNIVTYFVAAALLVECLSLAVVSNRAAIEDRLLLPPDEKRAARKR
jgi:NACHT domain